MNFSNFSKNKIKNISFVDMIVHDLITNQKIWKKPKYNLSNAAYHNFLTKLLYNNYKINSYIRSDI